MKNKITLFLLISALITAVNGLFAHPYYVSVTEIHIHRESETFDISCSMFTDDLENAIKKTLLTNTDLQKNITANEVLDLIFRYIQPRLQVAINGTATPYTLVGCENQEASTWCYLEGKYTSEISTVSVTNSLLFDFIPEQTNMVHVYLGDLRKSYKLNNPEKTVRFDF